MPFDIKRTLRPNILKLEPYRCARDDYKEGILLDANENTYGVSVEQLSAHEHGLELNRYPDPHQIDLKKQILAFRNKNFNRFVKKETPLLEADNLCLGVGSDESIDLLLRCVCTPGKDKLLICPPTYGMYSVCATVNDVELVKVPLTVPDFQTDNEKIVSTIESDSDIKLVYLTSPGNPTGKLIEPKRIIDLLEKLDNWNGFLVVDEAYIDFTQLDPETSTSQSMSTLVNQYPNLVVMQTLSKSFGLAGIRLGVTYCSKELSYYLNSMKYPYNISSLTSDIATRATSAAGLKIMKDTAKLIISQREYLLEQLQKLPGIGRNLGGLDSNFLLLEVLDKSGAPSNDVAKKLYQRLAQTHQVVVRFRGTELNCTGALRVTVGTPAENETLLKKFSSCFEEIYNL